MNGQKTKKQSAEKDEAGGDVAFRKGDWVVHKRLGVGRIVSLEKKPVQGERVDCFRIKGEDSSLWMPVEATDNGRIRPVASPSEMERVQRVLVRAPEPMASNHKTRISRIQDTLSDEGLRTKAALLRDLTGRRKRKSLNETEYRAMNTLFTRLTKEWAITFKITQTQAQEQINSILERSLRKLEKLSKK